MGPGIFNDQGKQIKGSSGEKRDQTVPKTNRVKHYNGNNKYNIFDTTETRHSRQLQYTAATKRDKLISMILIIICLLVGQTTSQIVAEIGNDDPVKC